MIDPKFARRQVNISRAVGEQRSVRRLDVELEGTSTSSFQEQIVNPPAMIELEQMKELMTPVIIPMTIQIQDLKKQLRQVTEEIEMLREKEKQRNLQQLKSKSEENVKKLRKMFNLPEITDNNKQSKFKEIKGMFDDCSDETDSVTFLNSVRDGEN